MTPFPGARSRTRAPEHDPDAEYHAGGHVTSVKTGADGGVRVRVGRARASGTPIVSRVAPGRKAEQALDGSGGVGGVNVWVISGEDAAALGVAPGIEVTPSLAKALRDANAAWKAWSDAKWISSARGGRSVSRFALVRRLLKRGHEPRVADAAAARACRDGLIDDEALADALAGAAVRAGRSGPAAIVAKLVRRGIDMAVARESVRRAAAGVDQGELACALAQRRAARTDLDPHDPRDARRLYAFLARRGFDSGACARALAHARAASRRAGH